MSNSQADRPDQDRWAQIRAQLRTVTDGGSDAAGRADTCWLPIAQGLTPHGLRHTYKTLMDLGTLAQLMDAQMGHEDGSVQARYAQSPRE